MTHAIEAFTCIGKNPLSDAYARAAIQRVAQNVIAVLDQPKDAPRRLELALAASMAGIAFSNSMVGLVHALGHTVGAIAHVPHGVCMNIFLPYVLEFNLPARASAIGELLLPLAGDEVFARTAPAERPQATIARLRALRDLLWHKAKLPRTLSETGKVQRSQLPEIARLSLDDGALLMNPVPVDYDQALAVLGRAY
jgi:alcohol dehydrogenase